MKRLFLILLSVCLLNVGCSTVSTEEKVGIRGNITSIYIDGDNGSILVEGKKEEDTVYDKASVSIDKNTIIQKDNLNRAFTINDLEIGTRVEVIFDGAVAESYPVQGKASVVKILSE